MANGDATDAIQLSAWGTDAVQYQLEPADPGEVRGANGDADVDDEAPGFPTVALPGASFDCISLDGLQDHPAVDALMRTELAAGAPFRILRFPFSLRPPEEGSVSEVRLTVRFLDTPGTAGARVHSIYPERIEVVDEQTSEVALEPSLKLCGAVEIGVGRVGRKIVARQSRSVIVGYWSEHGAEWALRPPDDEGLEGSWEFFVVARWQEAVTALPISLGLSAVVISPRSALRWRTRRLQRDYPPVALTGCAAIA
jgi:hypothetical protein